MSEIDKLKDIIKKQELIIEQHIKEIYRQREVILDLEDVFNDSAVDSLNAERGR